MIRKPLKANVSVIVKIPVQNLPAAECSIFILRKIYVPIPVQSVVRMNGIPPIKSEWPLKNPSTTSRTVFCVAGRKTQNEKTLHAGLLLAGITRLITVLVADKIHKHQYIRSLKPLIA